METKEILEGNRLIAEYMGFTESFVRNIKGKKYDFNILNGFTLIIEQETTIESQWCEILMDVDMCMVEDLIFHSSWDWLIPAICKVNYDKRFTEFTKEHSSPLQTVQVCLDDISVSYDDVVFFLKWLKEQDGN